MGHKNSGKWYVVVSCKGHKRKYGGMFKEELDAAKRVNQLCEELDIPPHNPGIQQSTKNCKTLLDVDVEMQAEFEALIKILDENNDPITPTIKQNLIMSINSEEQTILKFCFMVGVIGSLFSSSIFIKSS